MTTKSVIRPVKRPQRFTDAVRLMNLQESVDFCLARLRHLEAKEISNQTGLSLPTIYNLLKGNYSLDVRFGTVQLLGVAAGCKISMTEYEFPVVVVRPVKKGI